MNKDTVNLSYFLKSTLWSLFKTYNTIMYINYGRTYKKRYRKHVFKFKHIPLLLHYI